MVFSLKWFFFFNPVWRKFFLSLFELRSFPFYWCFSFRNLRMHFLDVGFVPIWLRFLYCLHQNSDSNTELFFFPLHSYFFQENSQSSDQPPKPPRLPLKEVNTVSLTVRLYGALIKNRLGASSNLAYRSMLPKLELLRGIHLVRAVGLGRDSTHLVIGGCL